MKRLTGVLLLITLLFPSISFAADVKVKDPCINAKVIDLPKLNCIYTTTNKSSKGSYVSNGVSFNSKKLSIEEVNRLQGLYQDLTNSTKKSYESISSIYGLIKKTSFTNSKYNVRKTVDPQTKIVKYEIFKDYLVSNSGLKGKGTLIDSAKSYIFGDNSSDGQTKLLSTVVITVDSYDLSKALAKMLIYAADVDTLFNISTAQDKKVVSGLKQVWNTYSGLDQKLSQEQIDTTKSNFRSSETRLDSLLETEKIYKCIKNKSLPSKKNFPSDPYFWRTCFPNDLVFSNFSIENLK